MLPSPRGWLGTKDDSHDAALELNKIAYEWCRKNTGECYTVFEMSPFRLNPIARVLEENSSLTRAHPAARVSFQTVAEFTILAASTASHVISVGCGPGRHEETLCGMIPGLDKKLILVDPDQLSYDESRGVIRKADFPTVADLTKARPEVVGDCLLLLIWPEPDERSTGYDFQAFEELNPTGVVALWEKPPDWKSGASGSAKLVNLLTHPREYGAELVAEASHAWLRGGFYSLLRDADAYIFSKVTWVSRKDVNVPDERLELVDGYFHPMEEEEEDSF